MRYSLISRSYVTTVSTLLSSTPILRKRFVPPWERDGKTADEFFAGIMQSSNPLLRQRRERKRETEAQAEALAEDSSSPEDLRRLDEMQQHNEQVLQQQREFLPYGAKPKRLFAESDMAAWGEYQSSLHACSPPRASGSDAPSADGAYSEQTKALLTDDMNSKIPYRYTSYVPPSPAATAGGSPVLNWPLHGTAGIVMDIDGVVSRSGKLIPGADEAVRVLQELKIPFVLMTNGAPTSEAVKAGELSCLLGCAIRQEQVLLAHSPMRLMAEEYRTKRVLIVGHPDCAAVAREYGFNGAMSILEYQAQHPEMVPYKKWGALKHAEPNTVPFPEIAAIFQFDDPDDVFSDAQTILDVLTAPHGQPGRYVTSTQSIPYFVSSDDLLWATESPLPRLGGGAFREMLSSVVESVTGGGLEIIMYGKPRRIAYAFAEQRLRSISASLGWDPAAMSAIFMVGDNIDTDIAGANAAGGLWTSVHVLSGIGRAPAARRTLADGDMEHEWLETCVSRVPHYVAPTMDHFVRELLAFPQAAMLHNKAPYFGKPNPVDLKEMYNFVK